MSNQKELFILRHGETNQNLSGIVQGSGIDSDLNQSGHAQGTAFFEKYKHHQFDLIIASQLKRSYQTIQKFESNEQKIILDDRINEICWGEHEGKQNEPQLMEKYYRIINAWKSEDYQAKPIEGESAAELMNRLLLFKSDLEATTFSKALVCTHGRTLRALICLFKNWPLAKMEDVLHNNTGLYHCVFSQNRWQIHQENDLSHLAL